MQVVTYTAILVPCIVLFFGVLVMLEIGRRLSLRRGRTDAGISAIDGAMLALMGLLIAFAFSGAMGRFDARRELVVQEANAIGTAWLRFDALPEASRSALRERFRTYVDSRLEIYRLLPDEAAAREALAASARIQGEIWALAVAATSEPEARHLTMLVLPALNEVIDITSTRTSVLLFHPPGVVFGMLIAVILIAALLAGYDITSKRDTSWLHRLVFAAIAAITVYVILEIEYGRIGLIRVDEADQFLIDVRASMG